MRLTVLFCAALVAGCQTAEERRAAERAEDIATCTDYGFRPGTPEFGRCRMELDARRDAENAAFAEGMRDRMRSMPQYQPPPVQQNPPPRHTYCYRTLGGMSCTTN